MENEIPSEQVDKKELPDDHESTLPSDNGSASQQVNKKDSSDDHEPPLPNDNRERWDWKTKYDDDAWKIIYKEAIYLGILLFVGFVLLIINYIRIPFAAVSFFQNKPESVVTKEFYCAIFGFIGGTIYGIKILYKAVAHGRWHADRKLWRIFTPWVSLVLSIVIASIMSDTILSINNYGAVLIGFFAGYFSESAIGKLYALANIIFD